MDDRVSLAYHAWPERIYVIGRDGRIAYRGGIGPFGFAPEEAGRALEELLATPKSAPASRPVGR